MLADLTPHMDQADIDDYFPDAIKSGTVDGRVYALPMEVEPLAMFYGVDAREKAGLSEGDIPETWDDLLDVGDKLRTPSRAGLVFETNPGYYQNFTWYPWMWQGGGDVLDAVFPLLWMPSGSFKTAAEVNSGTLVPSTPTRDNFAYVFTEVPFLRYMFNSFFVATVVTVVALLFHSMAARRAGRYRRLPGPVHLPASDHRVDQDVRLQIGAGHVPALSRHGQDRSSERPS